MNGKPIVLLLLLLYSGQLFAWGSDGHQLICALAEARLNAEGKKFLDAVLEMGELLDGGSEQKYRKFPQACLWPDEARYANFRGSYDNHFINVPKGSRSLDLARDCAALDCILAAIQRNIIYLESPANGKREQSRKVAALRFLGHFIGDLHQPLHVSYKEDRGGNNLSVDWFGENANLHRIWDTGLLESSGIRYPRSLEVLKADTFTATQANLLLWTRESYALAREMAYQNTRGTEIKPHDSLDEAYLKRGKRVVYQQLIKAGNRLALILNLIAEGNGPRFIRLSE